MHPLSIMFSNSRTLPGQSYKISFSISCFEILVNILPIFLEYILRKLFSHFFHKTPSPSKKLPASFWAPSVAAFWRPEKNTPYLQNRHPELPRNPHQSHPSIPRLPAPPFLFELPLKKPFTLSDRALTSARQIRAMRHLWSDCAAARGENQALAKPPPSYLKQATDFKCIRCTTPE